MDREKFSVWLPTERSDINRSCLHNLLCFLNVFAAWSMHIRYRHEQKTRRTHELEESLFLDKRPIDVVKNLSVRVCR